MESMNSWNISGHIGNTPETRITANGTSVCTLSVALTSRRKDKNDVWGNHTDWFRLVSFGSIAEFIGRYAEKGALIVCECTINNNNYTDRDGNTVYSNSFIIRKVNVLKSKNAEKNGQEHIPDTQEAEIPF